MTQRLLDRTYSLNTQEINPNDISVDEEEESNDQNGFEVSSGPAQSRRIDYKHDMKYSEMVGNFTFLNQFTLLRLLARGARDSNKPFSR